MEDFAQKAGAEMPLALSTVTERNETMSYIKSAQEKEDFKYAEYLAANPCPEEDLVYSRELEKK